MFLLSLIASVLFVTPEMFGAKGNGMSDDSPAFNECIRSGQKIVLKSGADYLLESSLVPIESTDFHLEGNNASLHISAQYPLHRYENIFNFSSRKDYGHLEFSNLDVSIMLGQKFTDRMALGDTYFIFVENASDVVISNVKYHDTGKYNNVSFFVSWGCNLRMRDCVLKSSTFSQQGGAVWLMNKNRSKCNIDISNVLFDFDDWDECVCVGTMEDSGLRMMNIKASFNDCIFHSNGKCASSGFVIAYNHSDSAAKIDIEYDKCRFEAFGANPRKIQSYQISECSGSRNSSFKTSYRNCDFRFVFDGRIDSGLLSLVPAECNNVIKNGNGYSFYGCNFFLRGVTPLIGDREGSRKGYFRFENCSIDSDCAVFTKRYNSRTSDISLYLKSCSIISADEWITSENIHAVKTAFHNIDGKTIGTRKCVYEKNDFTCDIRSCVVGDKVIDRLSYSSYPLFIRFSVSADQVAEICNGDSIAADSLYGKEVVIYYVSEEMPGNQYCYVNGKQLRMNYIEDEKAYFATARLDGEMLSTGKNTISFDRHRTKFEIR